MQIYKNIIISLLCLTYSFTSFSQPNFELIKDLETELVEIFDSLFFKNEIRFLRTDDEKISLNDSLLKLFREVLDAEGSFEYPFNKLIYCGILKSSDNLVRIYNWNLRFSDGSYKYYGFIQYYHPKHNEIYTWELKDVSKNIENPETLILNHNHWYGSLYYYIYTHKERNNTYYMLLGWDGNNFFTNKKTIEPLHFTKEGEPFFGKKVFNYKLRNQTRIIFEYSINVTMVLRYDDNVNAIVWDHLSPENLSKKDDYTYYGPDASYDGLKFEKGKWQYIPEIYVTNPKPKRRK